MKAEEIKSMTADIIRSLPKDVILVAAAKTRTVEEVNAVIDAGVAILGYNYVQEAERIYKEIGGIVKWHMIGHLQKNKAKKAVRIFDMIETLDSADLAKTVSRLCGELGKTMSVLIQVNSGREANKSGVLPEKVEELIRQIFDLPNIRVQGLMTMGPLVENPAELRPFFRETRKVFDYISGLNMPNVEMRYLSMGMSSSYEIAIEEGANMVRIGTRLFGHRVYKNN